MENTLEDVKLSSEGQANNISPCDKKFLFFFKPNSIDNECIGGISLVNGIFIFAAVSLLLAISNCMDIFNSELFLEKFGYIFLTGIFAIICVCSFFAALKENITLARISYILAGILFILAAVKFLCKSILKIIEFINPWDGDFLQLDFLIYILGRGLLLLIYLYFIWILFCFISNHDKNN